LNISFLIWLAGWRLQSWEWSDKWCATWDGRRFVLQKFDALDALLASEEGFRHGSYDD
jgi:hypothetical protein